MLLVSASMFRLIISLTQRYGISVNDKNELSVALNSDTVIPASCDLIAPSLATPASLMMAIVAKE